MERPDVKFTRADDGAYLAYQVFGDGPVTLFWSEDTFAMVDSWWDSPPERAWHEGLAGFARIVIHDRRGIGLSSRDVAPGNLEIQVTDILAVLDAVGSQRCAFGGFFESGAPNALLAATYPERISGLVWIAPTARTLWAPDYPWAASQEVIEREREITAGWGTGAWAQAFVDLYSDALSGPWGDETYIRFLATVSRRTCTPDIARELSTIWSETDVRGVLPSIQAPVLLMAPKIDGHVEHARYLQTQIPNAEIVTFPGPVLEYRDFGTVHEAIRGFIGAEPRAIDPEDRVLATLLMTDIVGSTQRAAEVGDAGWRRLIAEHDDRAKTEIERFRGTYVDSAGDGVFARFDGPARAIRCAQGIAEAVRPLGVDIRAGLHTGEVELDGDHVRGIAVHIGARVASLAGPSEVLVSSTVKDLVAGSGLTFEDVGEHELKGVPDRWRLYRVVSETGARLDPPGPQDPYRGS
ncbi:MAG TPA: adenylate/guanylate cyclase domain-containing protein [Actinomycetota bacterium]|nr:adenylate/guanylate cyclase domain-containing protein [Actinomycetota bacterium]